jgi:hypothetical protein
MLIFLGVQTAVDVNHLLPSMLIFSLLVTGPDKKRKEVCAMNIKSAISLHVTSRWKN